MVKLGISANDLARRAGIHHTTLIRIMNSEVSPELATMQKITGALQLSERDVLSHLQKLHPEHGEAE
jgi:predicted transcriptional regulator